MARDGAGLRVAVTGGAGFIGANLCRALCAEAAVAEVIVVDDLSGGATRASLPAAVNFVHGTILDRDVLTRAFAGADAVVHLAAVSSVPASIHDPVSTLLVNDIGSQFVLAAARRTGVDHVVTASSAAVYGDRTAPPIPEHAPTHPVSPYGISKLRSEARALDLAHAGGPAALVLRLFNVFGPRQRLAPGCGAVLPSFIAAALRGQSLAINGDGRQTRDMVYVDDLCGLIVDALIRRVHADTAVNVGSGTGVSIRTLADTLIHVMGQQLDCVATPPRPGDLRDSWAETTLLRQLFPAYAPTPLRIGLASTVDWFRTAPLPPLPARHATAAHQ